MARADLLYDLIDAGLDRDDVLFKRVVSAICADERRKQHGALAEKLESRLKESSKSGFGESSQVQRYIIDRPESTKNYYIEKIPKKTMDNLVLPTIVREQCEDIIQEQMRSDLLRSYGLEPRNKIILMGAPGNGKTSLAEAIAEKLMVPLITVRYDTLIGSYLGETTTRLMRLFKYAASLQCVLFFDEFDTIGKERADEHETGEIKRVVSSLLLQIDSLPSYVVAIAATNHDSLLDKAVWRRFNVKMELPSPTRESLEQWFDSFVYRNHFDFGYTTDSLAKRLEGASFAEAEEFALTVFRQYILSNEGADPYKLTSRQLSIKGC